MVGSRNEMKLADIRLLLAIVHDVNYYFSVLYAYIIGHHCVDKITSFQFKSQLQQTLLLPAFSEYLDWRAVTGLLDMIHLPL